jgi:hypothetical protein
MFLKFSILCLSCLWRRGATAGLPVEKGSHSRVACGEGEPQQGYLWRRGATAGLPVEKGSHSRVACGEGEPQQGYLWDLWLALA